MHVYTLSEDANILGERDPTFGYSYWVKTDKGPVMFSSHKQNILEGTTIVAESATPKTSKKGNAYHWLKGVSVGETTPAGDSQPVSGDSDVISKLNAIYGEVKVIRQAVLGIQKKLDEDKVVDVDPDEPINLEDIPF